MHRGKAVAIYLLMVTCNWGCLTCMRSFLHKTNAPMFLCAYRKINNVLLQSSVAYYYCNASMFSESAGIHPLIHQCAVIWELHSGNMSEFSNVPPTVGLGLVTRWPQFALELFFSLCLFVGSTVENYPLEPLAWVACFSRFGSLESCRTTFRSLPLAQYI